MFFIKNKKITLNLDKNQKGAALDDQKRQIKKKLEMVKHINKELGTAVNETKELSKNLSVKLKKNLKSSKEELVSSMCENLKEGIIILNHCGNIIQINSAAEKLLKIKKSDVLEKSLINLLNITDVNVRAFENFSKIIIKTINNNLNGKTKFIKIKDLIYKEHFLGCNILYDNFPVNLILPRCKKESTFLINISILENSPSDLDDINYVLTIEKLKNNKLQL